jgi:Mg/Co/Ni transporter MgtE
MLTKEMKRNVETLHKKRDFRRLNELFRTVPAVDVAEFIRAWPLQDQIQVIEELPVADSAKIFSRLRDFEGHVALTRIFHASQQRRKKSPHALHEPECSFGL